MLKKEKKKTKNSYSKKQLKKHIRILMRDLNNAKNTIASFVNNPPNQVVEKVPIIRKESLDDLARTTERLVNVSETLSSCARQLDSRLRELQYTIANAVIKSEHAYLPDRE